MEPYDSQVFATPIVEGAKYGAIAGLIATWSISTVIAASELELGLPISTFYAVMGISLGSTDFVTAALSGIWIASSYGNYSWSHHWGDSCKGGVPKKYNKFF